MCVFQRPDLVCGRASGGRLVGWKDIYVVVDELMKVLVFFGQ